MESYQTGYTRDLEVVGFDHSWMRSPRPDLNGLRVRSPTTGELFLIDRGYRRLIANPDIYNSLFRTWDGIVEDLDIEDIPLGSPISDGAILVRCDTSSHIYLVDDGTKRHITGPAVMDKYFLAWTRVHDVPHGVFDAIPTADEIDD